MTVYFANDGVLDLDTIRIMGASIKSEGAIGFFGTGLKFAIATLLRTGHTISIQVEGEFHTIDTRTTLIRGEPFDVVHLDGQALGYTTSLGKTWEPWQAYRELASNCRDEENGIVTIAGLTDDYDTVIMVSGEGIEKAHADRNTIFNESPVLAKSEDIEVRDGKSKLMFYRGIRVAEIMSEALFTYNFTTQMELTEDRTLKYPYYAGYHIANFFQETSDEELILQALLAPRGTLEHDISWTSYGRPGEVWMRVVEENRNNLHLSLQALDHWRSYVEDRTKALEQFELDPIEAEMLAEARALAIRVDPQYRENRLYFVREIGPNVLGRVMRGDVLIARAAFESVELLTGTLLEEHFHINLGHADESRTFQNFLINRMVHLAKRAR